MGWGIGLTAAGRMLVVGTSLWAQCFGLGAPVSPHALHGEIRQIFRVPWQSSSSGKGQCCKTLPADTQDFCRIGFSAA